MTARRIDRLLLGLGALLILISSYQLLFRPSDLIQGPKFGTLTSVLSVVKTKNALALDWRDATSGNDLSENQLIYTDQKSSAEVSLLEGPVIEIGENSLVRLKSSVSGQGLNISQGLIRTKIQEGKSLIVQMNGEDYIVEGNNADVQINIHNKKGEIGVLSGEVKVEVNGITENLTSTSALEIDGEKVSKKIIYFKTLSPENMKNIYTREEKSEVAFSWEPEEAAKVILGQDPSLKKSQALEASSANLIPGLYYYKIESDRGSSLINSFRVIQEVPPELIRPLSNDTVSILEGTDSKILLQWREQGNRFLLEWNDGETHLHEVTGLSFLADVNPALPFKWRLKVLNHDRPNALWTEWQEVNISFIPIPKVPDNLLPDGIEFQTYEEPNEKIEFTWENQDKVALEILRPDGEAFTTTASGLKFEYTAKVSGTYTWRAKGIDSYLRSSDWSDWKKFSIEDLSREVTKEKIQKIELIKPDQSITFNWKVEKGSVSVFELAKDKDFKNIVKRIEGSKDSVQVNVPEVGTYYWRSREYLPDGTFNVSEPRKVIIAPVPALIKPEKLPDLEVPLIERTKSTGVLKRFLEFFISSAYANELQGIVKIELPVKDEGKGYIIRIYRDSNLTELVHEQVIDSKSFEWNKAEAGEYYWQYAVIDFWDRKSQFSDPSLLTVKLEEVPLPEKSRLLTPIRAKQVLAQKLELVWSEAKQAVSYKLEVAKTQDFKNILVNETTKKTIADLSQKDFQDGLYFWRVTSFNKRGQSTLSNIGRFQIASPLPLEKKIFVRLPEIYQKQWNSRAFIAWAPSMDSYSFTDGKEGKIDGTALMSALLSGSVFKESFIFNGEVLRQTGEVFDGEKYLFQRLLLDSIYLFGKRANHKWGFGIAVGQTSGQVYEIQNSVIKSKASSGLSYGPTFRSYISFNRKWEMQGRAQYLLGDIKQMELGADAIRSFKSYLVLGGLSYSSREYELSSGKQTSLKISLGFGKEF